MQSGSLHFARSVQVALGRWGNDNSTMGRKRLARSLRSNKVRPKPRFLIDVDPLRRFPHFRHMWIGYSIRQIGTQLTLAAVLFQVFQLTHSNLDVGLISV